MIVYRRCLLALTLLGIVLAGSAYLYYHAPVEENRLLPKCAFYQITRLYCPGCGATRAYYSFLHGDYIKMFRYNPLIVPLLLVTVFLVFVPRLSTNNYVVIPILIVIIAYWVLRNLPWYPFILLAPPPL